MAGAPVEVEPTPADVLVVCTGLGLGGTQRVIANLAAGWQDRGRSVAVAVYTHPSDDFFQLPPAVATRRMRATRHRSRRSDRRWPATPLDDGAAHFRRAARAPSSPTNGQARARLIGAPLRQIGRVRWLRRTIQELRPKAVVSFGPNANLATLVATRGLPTRVVISERNDVERQPLEFDVRHFPGPSLPAGRRRHRQFPRHPRHPRPVGTSRQAALRPESADDPGRRPHRPSATRLRRPVRARRSAGSRPRSTSTCSSTPSPACRPELDHWRLAVVGSGPLENELRARAEAMGVSSRVDWHGPSRDPYAFYRHADVFALPSRYEGMPNALLEAMSFGLAPIVSDASPGPLEVVRDNETGLVVPTGDPDALAAAITRLATEPDLRRRLGDAARQEVTRFEGDEALATWDDVLGLHPLTGPLIGPLTGSGEPVHPAPAPVDAPLAGRRGAGPRPPRLAPTLRPHLRAPADCGRGCRPRPRPRPRRPRRGPRPGRDGGSLRDVLPQLVPVTAVVAYRRVADAVLTTEIMDLGHQAIRAAEDQVIDVATAVEFEAFEDPAFLDQLAAVGGQRRARPMEIAKGVMSLGGNGFGLVGLTWAMATLQPAAARLRDRRRGPLWLASVQNSQDSFSSDLRLAEANRRRTYLRNILTGKAEAKEVRAFGLTDFVRRRYDQAYDHWIEERRRVLRRRRRRTLRAVAASSVLSIVFGGCCWSCSSTPGIGLAGGRGRGLRRPPAPAAGRRARRRGGGALRVGPLPRRPAARSSTMKPRIEAARPTADRRRPVRQPVGGGRVSFAYPGTERLVLQDVSLELRAGEVVALVGENGCGKTTLAKLLCQLYRPQSGRILWDGTDTATVDPAVDHGTRSRWCSRTSCATSSTPTATSAWAGRRRSEDWDAVVDAPDTAGRPRVPRRPAPGLRHRPQPGRSPAGEDLSIGQWQRVALARAFFRDAAFLVLDEPTAALDPRAEHELFENLRRHTRRAVGAVHLPPLLERALRRPDLRPRPGSDRRTGHPRRAHGRRRPLRRAVHPAGHCVHLIAGLPDRALHVELDEAATTRPRTPWAGCG